MKLHIWAVLDIIGNKELWPIVNFTSRTAGNGTVDVHFGPFVRNEKFTISKEP